MQKEFNRALVFGRNVKSNTFETERGTYKIDIRVWRKNVYFFKYKDGVLVECMKLYGEKKGENENV
jgi:hypothetical protein